MQNGINLSLTFVFLLFSLHPILETQSQMIPISEVRTHPPSPKTDNQDQENPRKKVVVPMDTQRDPKAKEKADIHAKIAASHFQQEVEDQNQNDDEEEVFAESEGEESSNSKTKTKSESKSNPNPKVFRKDKSPEFQNPAKHASESWLLDFLLERYTQNALETETESIVKEQVDILQNLEHFAHKFENGRDLFTTTSALTTILLPALNSSHGEIRSGACSVFAVAAQNNLIVQGKSYQAGVIRRLVHLLTVDTAVVRSKALYALSSLLRNFPLAQQKFIGDGGVPTLVKVAFLPETRKRSLTLVTDLLQERIECDEESLAMARALRKARNKKSGRSEEDDDFLDGTEDPCDKNGQLKTALGTSGWCQVLEDSVKNLPGFGDDEQILIVDAVSPSLDICMEEMVELRDYFEQLLRKFEGDEEEEVGEVVARNLRRILEKLGEVSVGWTTSRTEL